MSACRTVYEIFSVKEWRDLETGGRGRSRSLKMAPCDRPYDFLLVRHCEYSCMLYHFQVILRWIIVSLKRSLKVIQTGTIWKIGCGFLFASHSNYGVSLTVYEIFSVKEWRDLETKGRGSRSLKIAPCDRPHTTFYWSAIVNIVLSSTVFELFDVEYVNVTWFHVLEIWVRGHSRSFKTVPFESLVAVSYLPSIVTMAPSWIICKIKRDIGQKSWFCHTHWHSTPPLRGSSSEYCHSVWYGKIRIVGLPDGEKFFEDMCIRLDTIPAYVRQTDRRADRQTDWLIATA